MRRRFEAFNQTEGIIAFLRARWTACFSGREAGPRRSGSRSSAACVDVINMAAESIPCGLDLAAKDSVKDERNGESDRGNPFSTPTPAPTATATSEATPRARGDLAPMSTVTRRAGQSLRALLQSLPPKFAQRDPCPVFKAKHPLPFLQGATKSTRHRSSQWASCC